MKRMLAGALLFALACFAFYASLSSPNPTAMQQAPV